MDLGIGNSFKLYKCPAKVLIAGGYGVLQQGNLGLSLALDSFFYSVLDQQKQHEQQLEQDRISVEVCSPQLNQSWAYVFLIKKKRLIALDSAQSGQHPANQFVEKSILHTLLYFHDSLTQASLKITLLFDKGFISQSSELDESKQTSHKFRNYTSNQYHKTGLGSSAGVVVSVVHQLCTWLGSTDPDLVNRLAQISNLCAQQKLGSNFDISTAVYGSQVYVNTLPRRAMEYLQKQQFRKHNLTNSPIFSEDILIRKLNKFGKGGQYLRMYMLDLEKGSDTRKMVGSFSKYLRECPEATRTQYLQVSNCIVQELQKVLSNPHISRQQTKAINDKHRKLLQEYSDMSEVPIQPKELRSLLYELEELQNVLYVVCPGSGGYDAISVLANGVVDFEALKDQRFRAVEYKIQNKGLRLAKQQQQLQARFYLINNPLRQ